MRGEPSLMFRFGFWKDRTHNLAKMTLGDLVRAYACYPTVHAYFGLTLACLYLAYRWFEGWLPLVASVALSALAYPFAEYALHRWVLHSQLLYRSPRTAKVWKRIHFDHHQDPHNLVVLFGALHTTVPAVALITGPIGYLAGGAAGVAIAWATGLVLVAAFEFIHCIQHLNTNPRTRYVKRLKQHHLLHHFHNEQANFGITSMFCDQLAGTGYAKATDRPKSPTVFNIGYTEEMARLYPWVAELSNNTRGDANPRRFRAGPGAAGSGQAE